jgi:GTP pyrophosphokinase
MIPGDTRTHMPKTSNLTRATLTPDTALAGLQAALADAGVATEPLELAREIAQTVLELTKDRALALGALLHAAAPDLDAMPQAAPLRAAAGPEAVKLAAALARLGEFGLDEHWAEAQSLNAAQAETLRKMLLAVVGDPRLVVARLAQQLVRARHARSLAPAERRRIALETRDLYAPIANRLGIWGVKWELEDLAFRELHPEDYRRIAAALNEKRRDRETYILRVCAQLAEEMQRAGIRAQLQGRPKHIYSIFRKMQRKHLDFEQLFDVRAVRIIVDTVADCYAALGIVHGLWPFIPGEFDDYIATPKDNNYRSIHTAVHGPDGRSLEIQIRTHEMQAQAELGVAAHWVYKEGAAQARQYERKIQAVRELLQPAGPHADDPEAFSRASAGLFDERIYAMTPKGEVVDLPRGATPLDFAFHVHSDLGQRCRGAKLNGRIVPLDHQVGNGDVVEILTAKNASPSRDWLSPERGYLASPRSRAKLRAYFRKVDEALATPGAAATHEPAPPTPATPAPPPTAKTRKLIGSGRSPVQIEGVGDLPITLARCCGPVRPQPITGYFTLGRGVTIHRAGCPSLARMLKAKPERQLNVEWSTGQQDLLAVRILIEAFDRRGLLRDISDLIAEERLSIEGVSSDTDPADKVARFQVRLGIPDKTALTRLMKRLERIPNVFRVRRAT